MTLFVQYRHRGRLFSTSDSTEPGHRVSTPAAGEGDVSVRHLLPAPENVAGDSDQVNASNNIFANES